LVSKIQETSAPVDEIDQGLFATEPPTKLDNVEEPPMVDSANVRKIKLNEQNLRRAWEVSQRSTKEDWLEWLRNFSVVLLRESPSPGLLVIFFDCKPASSFAFMHFSGQ
jgi:hypothetical protein